MTVKIMVFLPDQLVVRMKSVIPVIERNKVVAAILEKEIIARENGIYFCAKELEANEGVRKEMVAWDGEFGQDGLDDDANV